MTRVDIIRAEPLVVSVSGGATSAFLAHVCATQEPYLSRPLRFVFANTGAEHPETLDFVKRIDDEWSLGIVWVESRYADDGAHTHEIVTHATASRDGEPFEAMCARYGIPNHGHGRMTCTRELKVRAIRGYLRSVGLAAGSYDMAIGIRADEFDRMSANAERQRIVYPLVKMGVTRAHVESFWSARPWRLAIPNHLGNCVTCFKKTDRKLYRIAREAPEAFNLFRRLEQYAARGAGPQRTGEPARFFRGHRTVDDVIARATAQQTLAFDEDANVGACAETCEAVDDKE